MNECQPQSKVLVTCHWVLPLACSTYQWLLSVITTLDCNQNNIRGLLKESLPGVSTPDLLNLNLPGGTGTES